MTDEEWVTVIEDPDVLTLVSGWTGDKLSLFLELRARLRALENDTGASVPSIWTASGRQALTKAWVTQATLYRQLSLLDAEYAAQWKARIRSMIEDLEYCVHYFVLNIMQFLVQAKFGHFTWSKSLLRARSIVPCLRKRMRQGPMTSCLSTRPGLHFGGL